MRPGEITGLQLGDLRDRIFHISRRIYYGEVDTPKTKRGRRVIPATATPLALFEQWREFLPNQRADAWLFPSETGNTPVWYTNILDRSIRPSLETIGLGDVNFLVLRRSWVTEFSQVEKDPAIRAQIAGHSVGVHQNEYQQPAPVTLRRAMRKLEKRLQ